MLTQLANIKLRYHLFPLHDHLLCCIPTLAYRHNPFFKPADIVKDTVHMCLVKQELAPKAPALLTCCLLMKKLFAKTIATPLSTFIKLPADLWNKLFTKKQTSYTPRRQLIHEHYFTQ
jgi:hypothetical protein